MDANREASLRRILLENPRNARAMATLSCLLAENRSVQGAGDCDSYTITKDIADTHDSLLSDRNLRQKEALEWAERSVEYAPQQPFGHTALSLVRTDFSSRMESLRRAIDCSVHKKQHVVATAGLLVRLLVEPREEEVKRIRAGKGDNQPNPSVRPLCTAEELTYNRLEECLSLIWNETGPIVGKKEREFVALREYRLGLFFRRIDTQQSHDFFQASLDHFPANHVNISLARFWLATLPTSASSTVAKCPAQYVVGLYSTFASRFDELLVVKLEYRTPTLLRQLLDSAVASHKNGQQMFRSAADLGCGTGLSGMAFASCVTETFLGVDLSPYMLVEAKKRNCYHDLVTGDVSAILIKQRQYDLVIACDVFCYIGDLSEVFTKVYESLVGQGIFCFSTEWLSDASLGEPFVLHECARFSHKQSYVFDLAEETQFDVLVSKVCPIRKNRGREVIGLLAVLRKRTRSL